MLQLIIDAARGISAQVYWTKFFLGGSAISLIITLVTAWNTWTSQTTFLNTLKQIGLTLLKIVLMSIAGVIISWALAQVWSIPVIVVIALLLWWRY